MINNIINQFGTSYKRRRNELSYLCPFHNDRRIGSFSVNILTGRYHCFSCGAKGVVKNSNKYIPYKKTIIKEEEEKKIKYKINNSVDGYNSFKKYIKNRGITLDLDIFKNLRFTKYKNIIGLIINKKAVYNYYLDDNYNIRKNEENISIKGWMNGSNAEPFYLINKEFKKIQNLYIFEGLEDILSFINLFEVNYENDAFVSLFGITNIGQIDFENRFKDVNIFLCLDNDNPVNKLIKIKNYINKIKKIHFFKTLQENNVKDWNELLIKHQ